MNESQRKHLNEILERIGFEYGYTLRGDEDDEPQLTMEVWVREDASRTDELHIISSPNGLLRILVCNELADPHDGTNPNMDHVFNELERLGAALPKKKGRERRNPGDRT